MDKKIERIKRIHEMTDKEAAELIEKQSKKRKSLPQFTSENQGRDSRNYELSINSSKLGEDATTDMLEDYIKEKNPIYQKCEPVKTVFHFVLCYFMYLSGNLILCSYIFRIMLWILSLGF